MYLYTIYVSDNDLFPPDTITPDSIIINRLWLFTSDYTLEFNQKTTASSTKASEIQLTPNANFYKYTYNTHALL